ncbi:Galectin-4 like protein [Argiope bruennichi]|uniref:Galectin n=1 Tax=Argiope bruennichi TaxID=94029 RepID=A0A8T0EEA0_ARGBR|nr:Galectin-4 like protein [Argiope bruennichi]
MEIVGDMYQPFYPNPDAVVYNVTIPYQGGIPGGIYDGKMIEISGSVPYGAHRFEVNLNTGFDPSSDRALHISCRFDQHCVVRNSYERGCWSIEERQGSFPFSAGRDFTLMIMAEIGCYRIAVNGQHCWEFNHRLPMERVNSVSIDGSVQIHKIEFIDRMNPYRPSPYNPPPIAICPAAKVDPGFMPGVRPGICPVPSIPSFPSVPSNPGTCTIPAYPSFPPTTTCVIPPPEQLPGYIPGGSNLAPVYNPPIPYAYPIYGGLKSGMMIYISGRPSASAHRFTINFQNGTAPYPPPDIAFHFDVRFFSRSVVRNSRCNNTWAAEENLVAHFPFQPSVNFDLIIRVEFEKFMVAVNGQHFVEFRHRLKPLDRFDTLYIENDVIVSSIRFA